jgi:hypothetical protein
LQKYFWFLKINKYLCGTNSVQQAKAGGRRSGIPWFSQGRQAAAMPDESALHHQKSLTAGRWVFLAKNRGCEAAVFLFLVMP